MWMFRKLSNRAQTKISAGWGYRGARGAWVRGECRWLGFWKWLVDTNWNSRLERRLINWCWSWLKFRWTVSRQFIGIWHTRRIRNRSWTKRTRIRTRVSWRGREWGTYNLRRRITNPRRRVNKLWGGKRRAYCIAIRFRDPWSRRDI